MPRASRTFGAQTWTLKPGGSLILLTGSLSAAVGIGCAATGAIFAQGWTPELQKLVGGKQDAAGLLKAVQAEYLKELGR